ncbi:uncharacterized protein LOC113434525 [Pseudonaja textilis]|uniref:uncharacterized protein LOC113434525 n=1 Tax=Pseudonaja textilis TaxID=8673 RepID=UPI000EAA1F3F|nr:uncharacterized protein LOC113434525 [Pseudonaja textilis]
MELLGALGLAENLAYLEKTEETEHMDLMVRRALLVVLVLLERKALMDSLDYLGAQALKEKRASLEALEKWENLVLQENQVYLEIKVSLVRGVNLAKEDLLDNLVYKDLQEQQVSEVSRVVQDQVGNRAVLVPLGYGVNPASRVLLGFRDPKVTRALLELMDHLEVKENWRDREESLARKESSAPMERLDPQEFQAIPAKWVYKESKESLGLRGNQAPR